MRLSWNEIRARAAAFADEWQDAHYEKGETQSFYNDFFHIFDVKRRSVAVYERRVAKLNNKNGFIDLFMPTQLLVEQKSAGRDLTKARVQAEDYFLGLPEKERPRYILACNFQTFDLYDLAERTETSFALADLSDHVERFRFIMGSQKVAFKDQDPVNIKAAELVGKLHDQLEASGFKDADLERFLVRIVFCLFADDTGVFQPRNLFLEYLRERTSEDGTDLGPKLAQLFQTLDTQEDQRGAHLDEDLQDFPYVNGDLFNGATRIPAFDADMRAALIEASLFDWSPISPAIFGSLFQSVMDKEERRKKGAHYTTEKNILKVIGPLFMDGLLAEFERGKSLKRDKRKALQALQEKMWQLTLFDPACGCGNFLIIAYRELRRLEIDILKILDEMKPDGDRTGELDAAALSQIDVDQFHGIEIGEFPAEIARAAMWMMDHIMNNELSLAFGQNYARIPLKKSANIVCADALEIDWADVLAPEECDYVFGNPPFIGQSYQSKPQREQMARVINAKSGRAGSLDYVGAWFLKAGAYLNTTGHFPPTPAGEVAAKRSERATELTIRAAQQGKRPSGIAFVATNSITQGEQVAQLWPLLFERYGLEIAFAHRTFAWGSDARGKAHVHVVILGLVKRADEPAQKRLFSYPDIKGEPEETRHQALSPYLFDATKLQNRKLLISAANKPLSQVPSIIYGSKPADGGHLILSPEEARTAINSDPQLTPYIRRLLGANDFLNGEFRFCLWLTNCPPQLIRSNIWLGERIRGVRDFRLESTKEKTKEAAQIPQLFTEIRQPQSSYIVIPMHTSERREYVPFDFFDADVIVHNSCTCVPDAHLFDFAAMSSQMHMCWMRYTCGRLESRFRYANTLVYNTFPWPDLIAKAKATLTKTGQTILDARDNHPGATLADLYDPDAMPPDLRRAHSANDQAVDRLYRKRPFDSERERVEHLFALYEKLRAPLIEKPKGPKRH